jgi:cytochrome P450
MAFSRAEDLKHIPGRKRNYPFHDFRPFVSNASKFFTEFKGIYGDVFKVRIGPYMQVVLGGVDTNKQILVKESKKSQSKEAWEAGLGDLFPNSLMLMDGDEHKYHRGIMRDAFKKEPMKGYLSLMPDIIQKELGSLPVDGPNHMFPFYKNLTLSLATQVFFDISPDEDLTKINHAITDIVAAAIALPINLPFTKYRRGINGRKYLKGYFASIIRDRRDNPGDDLFSKFCIAKSEDGQSFTDAEIIDHLIFVLMASHDTTAITLTWMSYFLAKHPTWQQRVRDEIGDVDSSQLSLTDLRAFTVLSDVLKETLRIHPPLTLVARKTSEAMEVEGLTLPKDTMVACSFQLSHNDERVWSNPDQFDPERFSAQRKEHMKCPYAYAPFGAGPHHCIGYSFAEMQIKLVMIQLLQGYDLSCDPGYDAPVQDVPLKIPKDDLPLNISKRSVQS